MRNNVYDHRIHKLFNRSGSKNKRFKVKNQDSGAPEILIYDYIGWLGVEAEDFAEKINAINSDEINIRINSPGGSVFDGLAIYNVIKAHSAKVNVYIDSLAASIASIIALAGDKIYMAPNAFFMIHNAWGLCIGNKHEMREVADMLEQIDSDSLVKTYANNSNLNVDQIREFMDSETFFNAEDALAHGFIDEIIGEEPEEDGAGAKFDLSIYNNVPRALQGKADKQLPQNIKEFEQFLKDSGFSNRESVAIASKGYGTVSDSQPNAGEPRGDEIDLSRLESAIDALSIN